MLEPGALIALVFPLAAIYIIYRLIIGGGLNVFSPLRARMTMRTMSGENLAAILATISIAALVLDGSLILGTLGVPPPSVVSAFVSIALVATVGMALMPRTALAVVALGGLLAQFALIAAEHGPAAAASMAVLSTLMLIVLALTRGFASS